jgi:hypothetical protein
MLVINLLDNLSNPFVAHDDKVGQCVLLSCKVCGSMRIKEQTSQRHVLERNYIASSNINNFSTLTNEHDWEELCISKHALPITKTKVGGVQFSIQFLHILHHRFANAT